MRRLRITASVKRAVASRAKFCCEYCRSQESSSIDPFSAEHVIPVSKGGANTVDNLAYSCQGCNNHKYIKTTGIDPATGEHIPLFHPRKQRWTDHFTWSSDTTRMLGLSPTGRATIDTLHLNRNGLVNWRRNMAANGQHPPAEELSP